MDFIGIGIGLVGGALMFLWPRYRWLGFIILLTGLGFIAYPFLLSRPSPGVYSFQPQNNYDQIAVRFFNSGRTDLKPIEHIRLWIVPLKDNKTVDYKFDWIESNFKPEIKANGSMPSVSFNIPQSTALNAGLPKEMQVPNETLLAGVVILSSKLATGYFSHIRYSDKSGQAWYTLNDNRGNLDPAHWESMNTFKNKFESCLLKHSRDKNYSQCFPSNK